MKTMKTHQLINAAKSEANLKIFDKYLAELDARLEGKKHKQAINEINKARYGVGR